MPQAIESSLLHPATAVNSSQSVALITSSLVLLVGFFALVFWQLDNVLPNTPLPDVGAMVNANAAVCFVLAGTSLRLQLHIGSKNYLIQVAQGCAIVVLLIGLLTLLQYLSGWNLGIDELLFRDHAVSVPAYPGRMGDNTALCFALTGLALWLHGRKTRRTDAVVQAATICAIAIALLALVGYAYDVQVFYQLVFYSTVMPKLTAVTVLVLGVGILALQADRGYMHGITSVAIGSMAARRFIPIAITAPFGLGWFILQGYRAKLYDASFSIALFVISLISALVLLIWKSAQDLNQVDDDRKQAESDLQDRTEHIQLLYETTSDLLLNEQPLTLIDKLFTKLQQKLALDTYFYYLVDDERQRLHLTKYSGVTDSQAQALEWLEFGQEICGPVIAQHYQMVQTHVQQSINPEHNFIRSLGLDVYAYHPLIAQGKLFGTLSVGSRCRSHFTPAETHLLQTLCDQIAIGLERSALVHSLQQQTTELDQANRLKDEFLAALSHELRTPLHLMLGWTMVLKGDVPPEEKGQAIETIERSVRQQIMLVNDLLDISRTLQGKLHLDCQPVDLAVVLTEVIDNLSFAAQAQAIAIHLHSLPTLLTLGDRNRLQQICWNLLSNAIKFTPEGGAVAVDLEIMPNANAVTTAQLRVSDTGIGIAAEFLPHVFDYFRQADGSLKRKYSGLGLGLAIVQHLVELHGGTIQVESPGVGQGSTFTVILPLPRGDAL